MENLLYVVVAVAVSAVVSVVIVIRNRKPTSVSAGIEAFNRQLRALAPDEPAEEGRPRSRRPGEREHRPG